MKKILILFLAMGMSSLCFSQSDSEKLKAEIILLKARVSALESKYEAILIKLQEATGNSEIKPVQSYNSTIEPQKSTPKKEPAASGQCKATTQKGTRCSRAASSNGYCWQHGK